VLTLGDLPWDQALYGDKLVSRATLQQAFTPHAQERESTGYGFGWRIDDTAHAPHPPRRQLSGSAAISRAIRMSACRS
jgi:hypothetical protein